MIFERDLKRLCVHVEDSLAVALKRIDENEERFVAAVSEDGVLHGILTDGDFRRWALNNEGLDLSRPTKEAVNGDFQSILLGTPVKKIESLLSDRIVFMPVVDNLGRLVAIARSRKRSEKLFIEKREISESAPAFIIAEIGNNHNGSLSAAKDLVDAAIDAGANCVKFQMRDMAELYRSVGNSKISLDDEDLGAQYTIDLLSRTQLSPAQMREAFDYCREKGILALCTPWDQKSLGELEQFGMSAYKIASADLSNHDLLRSIAETGKPVLVSTGMSTEVEIEEAIAVLKECGARFALLHCNATYPAPYKDINLNYLDRLREISKGVVGYSGHERGSSIAIAAVARGAKIIEKHFTLNKDWEGNDHKVSLLPDEFKKMVEAIRHVEEAAGSSRPRTPTQGELINRETLAKSLVANISIHPGDRITEKHIAVKSPGRGLPPYMKKSLIGKIAQRAMKPGDFFFNNDLDEKRSKARKYSFSRPWGIPVRYHDFLSIASLSNPTLLEFHLSYHDLSTKLETVFSTEFSYGLVVHSPELFQHDHTLDLCSPNKAYREESIKEFQRVVEIASEIGHYFPATKKIPLVTNVGGFSQHEPLSVHERQKRVDLLLAGLEKIDTRNVEIIPQTMPPFPWHFGGQRYHNLFLEPESIRNFCDKYGYRICFDTSHTALWCHHSGDSIYEAASILGPISAHLHIADASGTGEEGLPIGSGDIRFDRLCEVIEETAPGASFIPEIWQGHKNHGERFWQALDALEGHLN